MNFLAHIYLSGNNDLLKIGNFMADSIRGNSYLNYHGDLQKGILLHRFIDSFTDANPIYRQSKHRLHEKYGHYSGVIMDIVYDHFLAKNWHNYSDESLDTYATKFYRLLHDNYTILTDNIKQILPYMIDNNWLVSYATLAGLEKILFQMDYKTNHRVNMQEAIVELQLFYTEFEREFTLFFEDIQQKCQEKITLL